MLARPEGCRSDRQETFDARGLQQLNRSNTTPWYADRRAWMSLNVPVSWITTIWSYNVTRQCDHESSGSSQGCAEAIWLLWTSTLTTLPRQRIHKHRGSGGYRQRLRCTGLFSVAQEASSDAPADSTDRASPDAPADSTD